MGGGKNHSSLAIGWKQNLVCFAIDTNELVPFAIYLSDPIRYFKKFYSEAKR